MSTRIQVVVDETEREAFRRRAATEGLSLSAWLRDAGRRRLADERSDGLRSVARLRAFFADLPEPDAGREPDWTEHRAVIAASRTQGSAPT